jgi:hypothetical protein
VALRSSRTDTAVEMIRHEMTASQQQPFRDELTGRLANLSSLLQEKNFEINGVVPEGCEVIERIEIWLGKFQGVLIADSPRVG